MSCFSYLVFISKLQPVTTKPPQSRDHPPKTAFLSWPLSPSSFFWPSLLSPPSSLLRSPSHISRVSISDPLVPPSSFSSERGTR